MKYLFLFSTIVLFSRAMQPSFFSTRFFLQHPNRLAEKYFNFSSIDVDLAELDRPFDLCLGAERILFSGCIERAQTQYTLLPVEAFALGLVCKAFEKYGVVPLWDFVSETEVKFFNVLNGSGADQFHQLIAEQENRILHLVGQIEGGRRSDEVADMVRVAAYSCNLY